MKESENNLISSRTIGGEYIDVSIWPTPDEGALEGIRRQQYFSRKQAVTLYLSGATSESIKGTTSIGAKQTSRLIKERCLEIHSDGRPYGWRGLVPYFRIQPYKRHKKISVDQFGSGGAGAMQMILDLHPDLRIDFDARIKGTISSKRLVEVKRSKRRHHMWFIDRLRRLGYEMRHEWPFNTSSFGYYSVCRYVDQVFALDPKALANATGGPDFVKKLESGDGTNRPVSRFMQRVEMDAHKLDGRFCVSLPQIDGGFIEKIVYRLWVIVILEITSRAVIGYNFCVKREVSREDVIRAIKRSLGRWAPRRISYSDMAYKENAGLLSSLGENFVGLCWDETSVDGAMAETCPLIKDALRDAVGSELLEPKTSFSVRRGKDDRPYIESFFRNLAGKGFQRMSNTTGAKPKDRKGTKPEEIAITSRFSYEYAEEILDVLIANYNATGHGKIGGRSPLSYAQFLFDCSDQTLRHADQSTVESLFSVRKLCVVRGGAKIGRGAYVEFCYARYTNEVLRNREDLVGKKIWVVCHKEDDCRIALASTFDGMPLGVLRAAPPWNRSPHSLSVRKAICLYERAGKFSLSADSDAIETFMSYVESQPGNKLPVHPAYLESRQILISAAEQVLGSSILESAKARAKEENEKGLSPNATNHKNSLASALQETKTDLKNKPVKPLPSRRMAAGR